MYEVVFKCSRCGTHMSAAADDAGYEFNCPACEAPLTVPAGDIFFDCPHCQKYLLASRNAIGERFDCPGCQEKVKVPGQGRQIKVETRPYVEQEQAAAVPPTTEDTAHTPKTQESTASERKERQFMSTWGGYMAAAGLTKKPDKDRRKKE